MRPPNSLTDAELKAYAEEHIQYEFDMLIWSAGVLVSSANYVDKGPLPWVITCGLLNTFAVHARNIIDFLYLGSMMGDRVTDIIIEDYIDKKTLANILPKISPLLVEARTKAHKQVAHLTSERMIQYEVAGKEWKFIEVAQHVSQALASIAPFIPGSRISDNLKQKLSRNLEVPIVNTSLKPDGVCFSLKI